MEPIYEKLYQFSTYIPPMDFTIHQYLLAVNPAIMFATGTLEQAAAILPEIKKILGEKTLGYVFISHMESDECGGVSAFLKEYPQVQILCSNLTARELPGYGYTGKIKAVSSQEELKDGELSLQFVDYPSEVHLQNGIVCYEKNSGIFYSADLMLRFGNGVGKHMEENWLKEVDAINEERIPNKEKLAKLKKDLSVINPKYIAVGHGYCVECEN